jgi:hypothetical protein
MDNHTLQSICDEIYRRFPEVKGARPKVSAYSGSQVLLIFTGKATTADGKSLSRTVRVVASEDGKIGKVTTSR